MLNNKLSDTEECGQYEDGCKDRTGDVCGVVPLVTEEVATVAELLTLVFPHHVVLTLDVEHSVLRSAAPGCHQANCNYILQYTYFILQAKGLVFMNQAQKDIHVDNNYMFAI